MFYRPLFLVSIVLAAVTAGAQYSPLDNNVSGHDFHHTISGTVRDINNHPVSGAHVELQDCLTSRIISSTETYTNGTFELTGVAKGRYEVIVTSGINEARAQVEYPATNEINLRIAADTSLADKSAGSKSSVSLSQMKVPGKARKLFQKAMEAFRASHLDDAFSFVQKALGLYPDYAEALTLRGVMNLQRGDTQSAEPDLQKAVELDYSDDMNFAALASLYNTEGKFDKAIQILNRGMTVQPNSWQGLTEMARAQIGKRDYEGALKVLAKADNYAPPSIAYLHLFRAQALLGLKNAPAATTELNAYLAKEPTGPNADTARTILVKLSAPETTEAKK